MRKLLVVIAALAIVATACSSSDSEPGTLTVYSGRSEELVQPLIDEFSEQTGIEVTVRYGDSAELAATILEEGDSSPADAFLAQDPASLGSVALQGLFDRIDDALIGRVPAEFSDDDSRWVGISGRARAVVYDSSLVSSDERPDTEDGFVAPEWEGRVAIAPTNGSFLAFVATKILVDGEDATRTWLEGMAANQSPTYPKNSAIVTAVNDGQVETGLVNHYYLLRALADDPSLPGRNHFFEVATAGSLVMPSGIGVLESSSRHEEAMQLVEFLLDVDAQTYFAEETYEYPLVPGVEADPRLPAIETIPTPDVNLSEIATTLDLATDLVAEAGLL